MAHEPRKITGAVLQSGRIFKAGQEDELAKVLPQGDIDRLVAKGELTGDWGSGATTADTQIANAATVEPAPAVTPAPVVAEPAPIAPDGAPQPTAKPDLIPTAPQPSSATRTHAPSGKATKTSTTKRK